MERVAFLGTGAMGSRMTARLIEAGFDVTVWNRTKTHAEPVMERGARWVDSPAEAARGADVVFSMVRDDAASRAVWLAPDSGALAGLDEGAVGIECSTLSVPWVRQLTTEFARTGRSFVDAPLAGSRPQAEAGALVFVAGGERGVIDSARSLFDVLGSAVHHVGENGSGATAKLLINASFGTQIALLAEWIELARRLDLDLERTVDAFAATPVCSPAVAGAARGMLGDAFPPSFPIDLVKKDFELISQTALAMNTALPISTTTGGTFARAVERGLAGHNITGIAQLYRPEAPNRTTKTG